MITRLAEPTSNWGCPCDFLTTEKTGETFWDFEFIECGFEIELLESVSVGDPQLDVGSANRVIICGFL